MQKFEKPKPTSNIFIENFTIYHNYIPSQYTSNLQVLIVMKPQRSNNSKNMIFGNLTKGFPSNGTKDSLYPFEFMRYKYLLHPIRLSICHILLRRMRVPICEIKDQLCLSWNKISNHKTVLEKLGIIKTKVQFWDGKKRKVMYLTTKGSIEFSHLLEKLSEFIRTSLVKKEN